MTISVAAALRRLNRMARPARMARKTRSVQSAMAGLMMAPLTAFKPKVAKPRKTATQKSSGTLGAVLKRLKAMQPLMPRARSGPSASGATPVVPQGAKFQTRTHRHAAGSRGYKLYLPASHPGQPKGLILMLHGCNQSPDDFALGTHMNALAEKHGLAIAWPAQTGRQNAAQCWNWFKPGDQMRGAGEPAILATLARKLGRELGVARDATFVAGLSAGGAMAAILADVYPDVFAAAGIHSGLARGAARDVVSAMAAMRNGGTSPGASPSGIAHPHPVRRIVFHGDADRTVHPSNAAMIVSASVGGAAAPVRVGKRSVRGRGYVRSDYAGADGAVMLELWMLDGAGHAWSGGRNAGSYTDRTGPDASAQMIRFFLAKPA
ncbi:MAG: alpha/beta hydrolase family esterase [Pseudorhodobacter sp.]